MKLPTNETARLIVTSKMTATRQTGWVPIFVKLRSPMGYIYMGHTYSQSGAKDLGSEPVESVAIIFELTDTPPRSR
jgi:hypothetical protein